MLELVRADAVSGEEFGERLLGFLEGFDFLAFDGCGRHLGSVNLDLGDGTFLNALDERRDGDVLWLVAFHDQQFRVVE